MHTSHHVIHSIYTSHHVIHSIYTSHHVIHSMYTAHHVIHSICILIIHIHIYVYCIGGLYLCVHVAPSPLWSGSSCATVRLTSSAAPLPRPNLNSLALCLSSSCLSRLLRIIFCLFITLRCDSSSRTCMGGRDEARAI